MPNDPRIKFRTPGKVCDKDIDYLRKHPEYLRDHPECRVVFAQHYSGGGGSSGRLRSVFEDGTPPERPPEPGGETGGGGTTDFVPANLPMPIKPGLDPGGIAGVTVGAIALAAAAAYAENERRKRINRGLPIPTDESTTRRSRPNLNRGGANPSRARGISRAVANITQQFEMTSTMPAARPAGPIQADFAPLSVASSPSSSGTSTPSAQSARSSAGSSSDLQSAISRPSSTTPAPSTRATYTGTDAAPDRIVSVFPDRTGAPAVADRGAGVGIEMANLPPPQRAPAPAFPNLQDELEMRQIEIRNLTISEPRAKALQREIDILEKQIRASGGTPTSLEDRIRLASSTPMNILDAQGNITVEGIQHVIDLTDRGATLENIKKVFSTSEKLTASKNMMEMTSRANSGAERYISGEKTGVSLKKKWNIIKEEGFIL